MPKCNLRTALQAVLLFSGLLAPLLITGCGNKKNSPKEEPSQSVSAVDSTSLSVLDGLIRENPKNPELFVKRSIIQASKKNYSQALNDITIALSLDSLKPAYYISQAEYFIFSGEPNSAKKGLNACLEKFPGNTDVMLKLAEIHLYMKEYGLSKLILNDVQAINDDLSQTYFLQGLIALENGDSTGAARNFQVSVEKSPEFYAGYIQAGRIYSARHDNLAIQYLKSAIDLEPDSYEAHYLLGMHYQNNGYYTEANQEYELISSRIDSTQPYPYYNRGYIEMVYFRNYPKAVEWFTKAIEKKPDYAEAWYNRGFSNELDGKLSKARDDYNKAMEILPNFPMAIKGLNRIDLGKPMKIN
ncbi:MAG: tetratricopeptide repeat protein [Bacteroidota bacterium]